MNRIKRVSFFFRVFFQFLFVLLPVLLIFGWYEAPHALLTLHGDLVIHMVPRSIPLLHPLSSTTKFLGFLISLIPTCIEMLVLYFLIKLFKLYEKGEIFTLNSVNYFRNVGYMLLIGQVVNPFYDALLSAALTWDNPPGHRIAVVIFNGKNIGIILIALLVILISWVMAEACKLNEEQQLTV